MFGRATITLGIGPHSSCLCYVLGSAVFHFVHGGPCGPGCQATMSLHAYAGDTQLYLHFCRNEIASSVDQLERCVLDIGHWMFANRLKLKADKTELLFASSSHSCATLSGRYPVLQLGADTAVACSHVLFVCSVLTSLLT